MRDRITRIELLVRHPARPESGWCALSSRDGSPESMFDAYMNRTDLSCCSFQGGFFIEVGERAWSDESTVDEFRMTMAWFRAVTALLTGAASFGPGYGPWEQSALVWTRYGDDVVMADSSAGDLMWGITVDLPSLAFDLAYHGRAFAAWIRAMRAIADSPQLDDPALASRAALVTKNLPDKPDLQIIDRLVDWVDPPA